MAVEMPCSQHGYAPPCPPCSDPERHEFEERDCDFNNPQPHCVRCGKRYLHPIHSEVDTFKREWEVAKVEPVNPAEDVIARAFHEAYGRLAPRFGRTRGASWENLSVDNRRLMRATVRELLDNGVIASR